jgi:beta-N-acetylhexosaminidase
MIARTCGSLIVGGFAGTSPPEGLLRALREGRRAGVILFKRNIEGGPTGVVELTRAIHAASDDAPPLVGVDQEGGRVARLGEPLLVVPPMRTVGSWADVGFAERIAHAVGVELAALGFTIDFAPVLDVDTRADNPVIGDRAFGSDAEVCARFGAAWVRGLQGAGILACGKHFPGHGDTSTDSHVDLPVVDRARDLERIDLVPFRAAAAAGTASIMTAHVVYDGVDAGLPATLSHAVCTVLREGVGFRGMLVSDDLEMRAISARWPVGEAAVLAVAAGCDALLVCSGEDNPERAFEALVREAESSPAMRARCEQAAARVMEARRRATARPLQGAALAEVVGGHESRAVAAGIAKRVAA